MNRVQNLADHDMQSCSLGAGVPSDDRLVVVQVNAHGVVKTIGARYRGERWIGDETGLDLIEDLKSYEYAMWFESPLFLPTSVGTTVSLTPV